MYKIKRCKTNNHRDITITKNLQRNTKKVQRHRKQIPSTLILRVKRQHREKAFLHKNAKMMESVFKTKSVN